MARSKKDENEYGCRMAQRTKGGNLHAFAMASYVDAVIGRVISWPVSRAAQTLG